MLSLLCGLPPKGAIMVNNGSGIPVPTGEGMPPIGYEDLGGFLPKDVPEEILGRILAVASYTPSGGNRRSHAFTVIPQGYTRRELMTELKRIYRLRSMALNHPILRMLLPPFVDPFTRSFLKDPEYGGRIRTIFEKLDKGGDPVFYDAPIAVAVHSRMLIPTPKEDSVLAGSAICLAAQSLGLGSCFVTLAQNAINASRACRRILGLAPEENIYSVILLGYPAVRFRRGRRPKGLRR
jgi:nitroreductase